MPTTTALTKAGGTLNADTAATAGTVAQRDAGGNLSAVGLFGTTVNLASGSYSANHSATELETFINMNATGGVVTATLPPAAAVPGQVIVVKKIDGSANVVTVAAQAGEAIDGVSSKNVTSQYAVIRVWSDGATWWTW